MTWADLVTFQQQLRSEVAEIIQQVRTELNDTVGGRTDVVNSINHAVRNMTVKPAPAPAPATPYQISDLIPKKLGRQPRQGILQKLHVAALVDAGVHCLKREDAGASRQRRQDGQ